MINQNFRIPEKWSVILDKIAESKTEPGVSKVTASDLIRLAISVMWIEKYKPARAG